jgi:hypothetical protein
MSGGGHIEPLVCHPGEGYKTCFPGLTNSSLKDFAVNSRHAILAHGESADSLGI